MGLGLRHTCFNSLAGQVAGFALLQSLLAQVSGAPTTFPPGNAQFLPPQPPPLPLPQQPVTPADVARSATLIQPLPGALPTATHAPAAVQQQQQHWQAAAPSAAMQAPQTQPPQSHAPPSQQQELTIAPKNPPTE